MTEATAALITSVARSSLAFTAAAIAKAKAGVGPFTTTNKHCYKHSHNSGLISCHMIAFHEGSKPF